MFVLLSTLTYHVMTIMMPLVPYNTQPVYGISHDISDPIKINSVCHQPEKRQVHLKIKDELGISHDIPIDVEYGRSGRSHANDFTFVTWCEKANY